MTVSEDRRSCFCLGAKRHCYDFARSGYLNLNPPTGGAGDLRDAIRARTCFLEAGYYQPLAERLEEILERIPSDRVMDAGCGEGYYTNRMTSAADTVMGIDLSTAGIDHAAKDAKSKSLRTPHPSRFACHLPLKGKAWALLHLYDKLDLSYRIGLIG